MPEENFPPELPNNADGTPRAPAAAAQQVPPGDAAQQTPAGDAAQQATIDHLLTVLHALPVGIWITDSQGHIIFGNSAAERIWRDSRKDEALAGWWYDTGEPLQAEDWGLSRAIQRRETVLNQILEIECYDGSHRIIRNSGLPLCDDQGHFLGAVALNEDITLQKRQERALQLLAAAGEALNAAFDYHTTLETLTRIALPHLGDWCLAYVLDEATGRHQMTGAHREPQRDVILQQLFRRFPPDVETNPFFAIPIKQGISHLVEEISDDLLQRVLKSPEETRLLEAVGRPWSAMAVPLMVEGRVLGVVLWTVTDANRRLTTEDLDMAEVLARLVGQALGRARLYQESQAARREAEAANQAKDEFLSVISHELRTPLTPILGWVTMLREMNMDDATRDHALDIIERNVRAQTVIVNDILEISRLNAGKLKLELHPLDPAPVVAQAVEGIMPLAGAQGIQVSLQLLSGGRRVLGDATRLQQVVWNLLHNAVKFSPPGSQVEVSLCEIPGRILLEVSDQGRGIEPSVLPFVFERFRQGDSSNSRLYGGLGIGLALVKSLVELHGGEVVGHSAGIGQGATFTVSLPVWNEESQPPPATAPPDSGLEANPLRGLLVLVVDDDDDTCELVQFVLRQHGAAVQRAGSAVQALGVLEHCRPDLLLIDLGLPGIDGYELLRRIQALPDRRLAAIPAVALSAFAMPHDRDRCAAAGFARHVAKPVDAQLLVQMVLDMVGHLQT